LKIEVSWGVTLCLCKQVSDTSKYRLAFIVWQAVQEGMWKEQRSPQYINGYEKRVACEVGEPNGEGIGGVWEVDVSLKRGIVWYCMVKELILKVKVWWSSKCQETLIQWHSVSSQELWSFSKTSVWTSDRTSYRLLFFLWEWHSIALWYPLQWNLYPLFPYVPFSHIYFSFILLCKISPL